MKINFTSFLQTGLLGEIAPSISRQDVYQLIGPPETISDNNKLWRANIWKYHSLQIAFEKTGKVSFIGIYFDNLLKFPDSIEIQDSFPQQGDTLEVVKSVLNTHQIPFAVLPVLTFDKQICLATESKVHIYFLDNLVHSVQLAG